MGPAAPSRYCGDAEEGRRCKIKTSGAVSIFVGSVRSGEREKCISLLSAGNGVVMLSTEDAAQADARE
ncbi:hypothetical protein EYF80_002854 [Liparis tanakae]|uniref:Uncharacterized protein n=1 Tax=Liparis tanakae TaxID=230148 RepID=A0A4Z2JA54_9TELE|nr:hypothetical protein EYF80_002854 [Liparis tanakae]